MFLPTASLSAIRPAYCVTTRRCRTILRLRRPARYAWLTCPLSFKVGCCHPSLRPIPPPRVGSFPIVPPWPSPIWLVADGLCLHHLDGQKLDPRYLGAYAVLVTTSLLIELISNLGLDKNSRSRDNERHSGSRARLLSGRASCPPCHGCAYGRMRVALTSRILLPASFRSVLVRRPLSVCIFPVVAAKKL